MPYPPASNLPQGTILFTQFKLNDFIFNATSSNMKHNFDFTPANSFVVECETQQEIDHYWERLGEEGHYSMCGWLQDKFGVSWQIVPKVLGELMTDPERAPRVIKAFMQMKKFDIDALLKA
jgi:predicted 3-demethylubiquinone-9 3-methyltransferase (glyoxalase superfamily)